jgi:hypothetical protein
MERLMLFRSAFPETFTGTGRARIQIFRTGQWKHPSYGPIKVDRTFLETVRRNFEQSEREVVLDYEHGSDLGQTPDAAIAAGWLRSLSVEGNTLWGEFDLTAKATAHVRAGEFRLCSPTWVMDYRDKRTGESCGPTLLAVGLTNRPFIEGMSPAVCLSERAEQIVAALIRETAQTKGKRMDVHEELRLLRERLERLEGQGGDSVRFASTPSPPATSEEAARRIIARVERAGKEEAERLPSTRRLSWTERWEKDAKDHPEDHRVYTFGSKPDPAAVLLKEGKAGTMDEAKRMASYQAHLDGGRPISWTGLTVAINGSEVRAVPERSRLLADFKAGRPVRARFAYGPLEIRDANRVQWAGFGKY